MSAGAAISTLVWALIVIIIIIVVVVVLFKVINLLFIGIAPQVSATFTAYTETVRGFPIGVLPSLIADTKIFNSYFSYF